MTNISDILVDVRLKWEKEVLTFLNEHFKNNRVPSHDLSHHKRTWSNASFLLKSLAEIKCTINPALVESAYLACMFHDSGMVVTRASDHGEESMKVFTLFMEKSKISLIGNSDLIKDAILRHDIKMDFIYEPFIPGQKPDLLTILGISDDIDALGIIGIYRFTEIYLHRGISINKLGIKVLENVSARFNNMMKVITTVPGFSNKIRNPYKEIINFFDNYNQQLVTETEPDKVFNGHVGVVNYIRSFSVEGKLRPEQIPNALKSFTSPLFIVQFFNELHDEIIKTAS